MSPEAPVYQTRELSMKTWKDFEKLFRKPGEWGDCWCMWYHQPGPMPKKERESLTNEQIIAKNRKGKKSLVDEGRSHGILVYSGREPVGWCQYGPNDELPRIDARRNYRKLALNARGEKLWRITCFCVDKKFRNRGVASAGLAAAMNSMRMRGGGLVEAYPIEDWKDLENWYGTVSMFKKEGFESVASLGKHNILVRKTV